MTVTQTIEIPIDRRVHLDFEVPSEIPVGRARVELTCTPEPVPLLSLRGSCKGLDTMEAYFERKRADKLLEDSQTRRGS